MSSDDLLTTQAAKRDELRDRMSQANAFAAQAASDMKARPHRDRSFTLYNALQELKKRDEGHLKAELYKFPPYDTLSPKRRLEILTKAFPHGVPWRAVEDTSNQIAIAALDSKDIPTIDKRYGLVGHCIQLTDGSDNTVYKVTGFKPATLGLGAGMHTIEPLEGGDEEKIKLLRNNNGGRPYNVVNCFSTDQLQQALATPAQDGGARKTRKTRRGRRRRRSGRKTRARARVRRTTHRRRRTRRKRRGRRTRAHRRRR